MSELKTTRYHAYESRPLKESLGSRSIGPARGRPVNYSNRLKAYLKTRSVRRRAPTGTSNPRPRARDRRTPTAARVRRRRRPRLSTRGHGFVREDAEEGEARRRRGGRFGWERWRRPASDGADRATVGGFEDDEEDFKGCEKRCVMMMVTTVVDARVGGWRWRRGTRGDGDAAAGDRGGAANLDVCRRRWRRSGARVVRDDRTRGAVASIRVLETRSKTDGAGF